MKIEFYEGNRLVFSGDCEDEKRSLALSHTHAENEIDEAFEYFRRGENVRINLLDMITADRLNGEYTKNVYWIMCVIKEHGLLHRIDPRSAVLIGENILPMMEAYMSLYKLKLKRSTEALRFAETVTSVNESFLADECSADEAMEKIASVLPSRSSVRATLKLRPRYSEYLVIARALEKYCNLSDSAEKVEALISEFIEPEKNDEM